MHKAVFLDRDGTIIEDTGYINSLHNIHFIPGAIDAIKKLNDAGFKVVVITNQSGVARGILSEDMLQTINKTMQKYILHGGAHIDAVYYCPHHPEHGVYPYKQDCACRKPHPGLIHKAQKDLKLDLAHSFMVGDKAIDIETGQKAGITSILVLTGRGKEEEPLVAIPPEHIATNLKMAAEWIIDTDAALSV